MQQISRREALDILGLKPSYTLDDLKKVYREKAKYFHPDKGNDPTGEAMKSINLAYEILKKMPTQGFNDYGSGTIDLEAYKRSKLVEISKVLNNIELLEKNDLWQTILQVSLTIKNITNRYEQLIKNSNSKFQVDMLFGEFVNKIYQEFKKIENSFYSLYPYVKEKNKVIDYDTNIVLAFVKKLNLIRDSVYGELRDELEKKLSNMFSMYVGYDILKEQIQGIVDKYAKVIMHSSSKNKFILVMCEEVEILFKDTIKDPRRVEEYKLLLDSMNDTGSVIIRKRIEKLKDMFNSDDFEAEVASIASEISSINDGTYIKLLRDKLIDKSAIVLKKSGSIDTFKKVTTILEICFMLLEEVNKGLLNYDIIYSLHDITFESIDEDRKKLAYIINNGEKLNPGYIYIRKDFDFMSDNFSIVTFEHDDYIMHSMGLLKSSKIKVNKSLVDKSYISLLNFMANAEFIGKSAVSAYSTVVSVLYRYKDIYMLMESDESISITYGSVNYTNVRLNHNALKYKDRQLVLDKLSIQLSQSFSFKTKTKTK